MDNQPAYQNDIDAIASFVSRIFRIEDITLGSAQLGFEVRYRGMLLSEDSQAAYDQLAAQVKPMGLTPLFRKDGDRHAILLVRGAIPAAKPANPWINLALFIATLFSVMLTGALYGMEGALPSDPLQLVFTFIQRGWPFAVSMIAILGTHEMGHYIAGRRHGLNVTLPYFIPMPLSPFGTMGAFINMKDIPRNRRVLLDVGMAGPLSGLVVCIPVLLLGLKLSQLNFLPASFSAQPGLTLEGNSLIYLACKWIIFGKLLPQPVDFAGLSPFLYWVRYFFTGFPAPAGAQDVLLGPVAWAGWAGLLVTGLNLIPAGQLDGGHILYTLFGKKVAQMVFPVILGLLVVLGFGWNGWWIWAALIFLIGRRYAEPLDQITPLDAKRKVLAVIALIVFFLTFTPIPMILF